jgi:hypothetical protein
MFKGHHHQGTWEENPSLCCTHLRNTRAKRAEFQASCTWIDIHWEQGLLTFCMIDSDGKFSLTLSFGTRKTQVPARSTFYGVVSHAMGEQVSKE